MSPPMSQPLLSVIAPCFNEEGNIEILAERTLATFDSMDIEAELVLIDDGSADDTWARISEAAAAFERVRGVQHPVNQGLEAAWKTGLGQASGPLVCLIDSDLQNRPEDIARLYEVYRDGDGDIVQAVRQPEGEVIRLAFSRTLNHVLNLSFGMRLRDNKSGFILCKVEILKSLLEHRFEYRYFQSFVGAAAGVRGYRIAEVDTSFDRRNAGQSFLANVPIRTSLRICVELVKYRFETWKS